MIARLEVTRGPLTEYPLAEKVCGGWQNGVMFYPDAEVTKVTPLIFRNETPTDDEREALISAAHKEADQRYGATDWTDGPGSSTFRRVDRGQAGAFVEGALWRDRRSEVPEPSAEDAMSHYTDPADPFWQSHPEPQGEQSDAGVDDAWWKAQEAGQLPRTPGPSIRQAFKAGYRAALRAAGVGGVQ